MKNLRGEQPLKDKDEMDADDIMNDLMKKTGWTKEEVIEKLNKLKEKLNKK